MKCFRVQTRYLRACAVFILAAFSFSAYAADKELLDILLDNGAITEEQHKELMKRPSLTSQDFKATEEMVDRKVDEALNKKVEEEFPVKVSYGKKGFRLESRDGNWQTNLQWRAQMRWTDPYRSDPRNIDDFAIAGQNNEESTAELRRVRMKIGGHGFRPWLGYYFEVDLQPTRDTGDDSESSSSRVIDWRITVSKYEALGLRIGQWKIDYNRERVDSSGRQQFVERSIVNRQFTVDRQVGAQLRGRLFKGTNADMRYYAGVFTGEGRGVQNDNDDLMYIGRVQWNLLGRDLKLRQTDVEYTKKPAATVSFGAATGTGRCTRWSSSGCGNLDGFTRPGSARNGQFTVDQWQIGSAFKYRGFSWQQEYHWKTVDDNMNRTTSDMEGGYVQSGYFFHNLIPFVPRELELAGRYAFVHEPNEDNVEVNNKREEYSVVANWFFSGHNNKITADWSHLNLEDRVVGRRVNDNRFRVQYDVSF